MTNDVPDRLARFTPAAGRLDRDEILFQAGRASAPTPRVWKLAVAGLIVSNLVALAPRPAPPSPVPVADAPRSEPVELPAAAPPESPGVVPHPSSYLALSRRWDGADPPPAPVPAGPAAPTPKPLTAGSRGDSLS